MPKIRVDLMTPIEDGQSLIFKSPVDCSDITGLIVYFPDGNSITSIIFDFADAHGNNVGNLNLFAENTLVKVILDISLHRAYVQNADTNAYIEGELQKRLLAIESPSDKGCFYQELVTEDGSIEKVWLNPPMNKGEYRTFEYFLGKPVYTSIQALTFASSAYNSKYVTLNGAKNVTTEFLYVDGNLLVPYTDESSPVSIAREGSSRFIVKWDFNNSKFSTGGTVYAIAKYNKE